MSPQWMRTVLEAATVKSGNINVNINKVLTQTKQ